MTVKELRDRLGIFKIDSLKERICSNQFCLYLV